MTPLILAAALAALPAGRGAILSAPVDVVTSTPGAFVVMAWRDHSGNARSASCVSPCTLHPAKLGPVVLRVEMPGYTAELPLMRWELKGATYRITPSPVFVHLTPDSAAGSPSQTQKVAAQ